MFRIIFLTIDFKNAWLFEIRSLEILIVDEFMSDMRPDSFSFEHHVSAETLERLRIVNSFADKDWLDLLQVSWRDYVLIRTGHKKLSEKDLINLADHFLCEPQKIIQNDFDYQGLQIKSEKESWKIPDQYSFAQYGRGRTTITTFDYLEKHYGWRLRHDVLKHLNLSESLLVDPFAPISMKIITETLSYLSHRHFRSRDFFAMGLHTYLGNANTLLAKFYSELESPEEILEHSWGDCLKFYEQNCKYRFLSLNAQGARIEVKSDTHVADEMGVRHLGNEHICQLKAGMMASASLYKGRPPAKVIETSCVHKGDESCVFEVTFPSGRKFGH